MDRSDVPTAEEAELLDRLHAFENVYGMTSDEFFVRWERGELPHDDDLFVWAGLCGFMGARDLDPA